MAEVDLVELRRVYLEGRDPTEQVVIEQLFGGDSLVWGEWCISHEEEVSRLRAELERRMVSEAIGQMVGLAAEGNYMAAKWLAEKGWKEKKVGRPLEKAGKLRVERERASGVVMRDYDRLVVLEGGKASNG